MFDVVWTDPNTESVGERRARKAQEKADSERGRSSRSSVTSRATSRSSHDERAFFFSNRNAKSRGRSESNKSQAATPSLLSTATPTAGDFSQTRRNSAYSARSQELARTPDGSYKPPFFEACGPSPRSSKVLLESVFSRSSDRPRSDSAPSIADSIMSKTSFVQDLGKSSFITKTTEISIGQLTLREDIGEGKSEVQISAEGAPPDRPSSVCGNDDDHVFLHPPMALAPSLVCSSPTSPSNPEQWKSPESWGDYVPTTELLPLPPRDKARATLRTEEDNPMSLDLNGMMREIRRMVAASPKLTLKRLCEDWGNSTDATLYKELEMEKKRWMLTALYTLEKDLDEIIMSSQQEKILSLYENHATASFLAGLYSESEITHMSTSPLSKVLYPNVTPKRCLVLKQNLSLAPAQFTRVSCMSLPSLFPASDMPTLLRQIHRSLKPGGKFTILLLNPTPTPATLGPKMRHWLDENLILNLEKEFRCTNPAKLFPIWLADAQLRAEGSTITRIKFFAATTPPDQPELEDDDSTAIRLQLRAMLGRLMWREVWGKSVHSETWWWEHPEIMEECKELGTMWDFSFIEAVKSAL